MYIYMYGYLVYLVVKVYVYMYIYMYGYLVMVYKWYMFGICLVDRPDIFSDRGICLVVVIIVIIGINRPDYVYLYVCPHVFISFSF